MISATDKLLLAMGVGVKGPKPEGATSIYRVTWYLRSDSFDGLTARISSSKTPTALIKSKSFASKDKADKLVEEIKAAFKTLDYNMEGMVCIEEDWYE